MSKLNDEILDTLYDARERLVFSIEFYKKNGDERNERLSSYKIARLDRVWNYFQAQRTIEDYAPEEED